MLEKIVLVHNDEIVNSDSTSAKLFNEYFNGITKTLDIHEWPQNFGQKTDAIRSVTQSLDTLTILVSLKSETFFLVTPLSLPILILKLSIKWLCH